MKQIVFIVCSTLASCLVACGFLFLYGLKAHEFTTQVIYPTDFIECVVYNDKVMSCYRIEEVTP